MNESKNIYESLSTIELHIRDVSRVFLCDDFFADYSASTFRPHSGDWKTMAGQVIAAFEFESEIDQVFNRLAEEKAISTEYLNDQRLAIERPNLYH